MVDGAWSVSGKNYPCLTCGRVQAQNEDLDAIAVYGLDDGLCWRGGVGCRKGEGETMERDIETLQRRLEDGDALDALDLLVKFFTLILVGRDGWIRCGDQVKHLPSDEHWLVAYADYRRGAISWAGWPSGRANIVDCVRTRVATDAQHAAEVERWLTVPAGSGRDDHRANEVRRIYAPGLR